MGLLLLPIPITLIPIQATCRERLWRGVRELRWVPLLGALGAATGAIAIGTAATSTSITTIISIGTTIRTSIGVKLVRATTGSTIRNTAEMHPTETGKQPISSADVPPVAPVVPVVRVALVVPENPVEPESPVVALELVIGPAVVPELVIGQVGAELELVQVVEELEHVQ